MIYILIPAVIGFFCMWRLSEYDNKNLVAWERTQVIQLINKNKIEYLKDRGSSFDKKGNLLWAKDDAMAYSDGMDKAISILIEREQKR
jgi:hypothetical protein